jgi:hypothetical protein
MERNEIGPNLREHSTPANRMVRLCNAHKQMSTK